MMKLYNPFIFLLLGILLISCGDTSQRNGEIANYIPKDASTIIKVKNLESFKGDVNSNPIVNKLGNPNPYTFFSQDSPIFRHLQPTSESIIAYSEVTDSTTAFTFITKETNGIFVPDSIPNKTIETLAYNNLSMQRVTIDEDIAFMARIDSVFIASNSQKVLQDIIKDTGETNPTLQKIYTIKENADVDVLSKSSNVYLQDSTLVNFASWTSMDMTILPNGLSGTGVVLARDTVPQLLNVFKGQQPQINELANVTPADASNVFIFTLSDAAVFQNRISEFRNTKSAATTGIFESINEVGAIQLASGSVVAARSIDPMLTQEALAPYMTEASTFRDVMIHEFSEPTLFSDSFFPLLPRLETSFVFQLDTFFVFTPSEELANQMIIAYKNNDVLANSATFKDTATKLSSSSSMVFYTLDGKLPASLSGLFNTINTSANELLQDIPFAVLQYNYDRDFAHVNFIAEETSESKVIAAGVSEKQNIKLNSEVLGKPQFFSNHRTDGQDIVYQDISNKLFLYSENGKQLWVKDLESAILGEIQEVDLLRNGKMQLAFTTKNRLYVLDRNGNDVGGFPLKFKDEITQPLAVFDYDDNRKYRFVVVQGREVYMYDSEANRVKGFTFDKAQSNIVQSPKHIRTGNKDYILIPEQNGKLNILSRRGTSRVKVSKDFSFSEVPITTEERDFIVIDSENIKHTISQTGKVSSQKLDVSNSYYFTTSGSLKVTMDENLLRVNGTLTELPFGIYTKPQIYIANNTSYITVTETQEKKVYVFNRSGDLLSGFPIFGTTEATISVGAKKGTVYLLTQGDDKEILSYVLK